MTEARNGSADYARLMIARAQGEVAALRPEIAPYFGPEADQEPAQPETVETTPPAPPGFVSREEDSKEPVPPALVVSRQPAPRHAEGAPEAERRQASIAEPRLVSASPPQKPVHTPEHGLPAAVTGEPPPPPKPGERRKEAVSVEAAPPAARAIPQPRPDIAGEIARALARLQLAPEASERLMPPQPSREKPAAVAQTRPPHDTPPEVEASDPWPNGEKTVGSADMEPLHIHIGELVIAPDPAAAPPRRAPAATAKWAPALSLDDYRTQRMRGER